MPKNNVIWELNNYSTDVMTGGSDRYAQLYYQLIGSLKKNG